MNTDEKMAEGIKIIARRYYENLLIIAEAMQNLKKAASELNKIIEDRKNGK